ncbi:hypothetical protein GJ496_002937 [Pomphorhynchus laevis]|nr:hypothetical protein GJ496_002937 [Pomphorhynchus laevis]
MNSAFFALGLSSTLGIESILMEIPLLVVSNLPLIWMLPIILALVLNVSDIVSFLFTKLLCLCTNYNLSRSIYFVFIFKLIAYILVGCVFNDVQNYYCHWDVNGVGENKLVSYHRFCFLIFSIFIVFVLDLSSRILCQIYCIMFKGNLHHKYLNLGLLASPMLTCVLVWIQHYSSIGRTVFSEISYAINKSIMKNQIVDSSSNSYKNWFPIITFMFIVSLLLFLLFIRFLYLEESITKNYHRERKFFRVRNLFSVGLSFNKHLINMGELENSMYNVFLNTAPCEEELDVKKVDKPYEKINLDCWWYVKNIDLCGKLFLNEKADDLKAKSLLPDSLKIVLKKVIPSQITIMKFTFAYLCIVDCGILPGLTSLSMLPYGYHCYLIGSMIIPITDSFAFLLEKLYTASKALNIHYIAALGFLMTTSIILTVYFSPNPMLVHSTLGIIFGLMQWVLATTVISFGRITICRNLDYPKFSFNEALIIRFAVIIFGGIQMLMLSSVNKYYSKFKNISIPYSDFAIL